MKRHPVGGFHPGLAEFDREFGHLFHRPEAERQILELAVILWGRQIADSVQPRLQLMHVVDWAEQPGSEQPPALKSELKLGAAGASLPEASSFARRESRRARIPL